MSYWINDSHQMTSLLCLNMSVIISALDVVLKPTSVRIDSVDELTSGGLFVLVLADDLDGRMAMLIDCVDEVTFALRSGRLLFVMANSVSVDNMSSVFVNDRYFDALSILCLLFFVRAIRVGRSMWVVGARTVLFFVLWLNYRGRRSWWRDWVVSMRLMMEVVLEPWIVLRLLPVIRFVIVPMVLPWVSVRLWAGRHMSLPVILLLGLGLFDLLSLALRLALALGLGLRLRLRLGAAARAL